MKYAIAFACHALLLVMAAGASAQPADEGPKRGELTLEDAGVDGLDLTLTGQYLLRFRHFEGHDFVSGGNTNVFRQRARLGVEVVYDDMVGVMLQVQDVRIWGEERSTIGDFSGDGLDMHQAYLRIMPIDSLELRLGRQEIGLENHRLIGTVGWLEQARAFDALRLLFKQDMVKVDAFYAKVAEPDSLTTNPDGSPFHADDVDLLAASVHLQPVSEVGIGMLMVGDFGSPTNLKRLTMGLLVGGKTGYGLSYGAEGYYQHGEADGDVSHRAFMVGGHLGYAFKVPIKPSIKLFADVLSGDADPADDTRRSFNTLFHTGHKFYGEMDYFLNLPVHTGQRGLVDVGAGVSVKPVKPVKLSLKYHHFRATASRPDGLDTFGNEVDAKVSYSPWSLLKLDLFYGLFAPGDIFQAGVADTKLEHFIYSTADFGF